MPPKQRSKANSSGRLGSDRSISANVSTQQPRETGSPLSDGEIEHRILTIFLYRHLLRNLAEERKAIEQEEQANAPRVKGPRAAAVLVRLWLNSQEHLPAVPQKTIALDLDIGDAEVGRVLKDFRGTGSNGEPCVELISDKYARERKYKITDAGTDELKKWIIAHNTHGSFFRLVQQIPVPVELLDQWVSALRDEVIKKLA